MDRPYAAFIGVRVDQDRHGAPLCILQPTERVSGGGGLLHSGALAGLLEAAAGTLVESVIDDPAMDVRPVSITVDYLRAGLFAETFANAEIVRHGERIVHVDASAWQDDADRPIAMARLVFSLRRDDVRTVVSAKIDSQDI